MTRKLFAVATAFTFAFSFLPASAQQGLAQSGQSMQAEQPAATSPHGEDVVSLGDLHLFGFFTRETPPNARNAGGFLATVLQGEEPEESKLGGLLTAG